MYRVPPTTSEEYDLKERTRFYRMHMSNVSKAEPVVDDKKPPTAGRILLFEERRAKFRIKEKEDIKERSKLMNQATARRSYSGKSSISPRIQTTQQLHKTSPEFSLWAESFNEQEKEILLTTRRRKEEIDYSPKRSLTSLTPPRKSQSITSPMQKTAPQSAIKPRPKVSVNSPEISPFLLQIQDNSPFQKKSPFAKDQSLRVETETIDFGFDSYSQSPSPKSPTRNRFSTRKSPNLSPKIKTLNYRASSPKSTPQKNKDSKPAVKEHSPNKSKPTKTFQHKVENNDDDLFNKTSSRQYQRSTSSFSSDSFDESKNSSKVFNEFSQNSKKRNTSKDSFDSFKSKESSKQNVSSSNKEKNGETNSFDSFDDTSSPQKESDTKDSFVSVSSSPNNAFTTGKSSNQDKQSSNNQSSEKKSSSSIKEKSSDFDD